MTYCAKSKHSTKLILFPVFSTYFGNTFVFTPHFWSQTECRPDVGLKCRRKVFLRAVEGAAPSCPHLASSVPNRTPVTSQYLWGKSKSIKTRYAIEHKTWWCTKWATQTEKFKSQSVVPWKCKNCKFFFNMGTTNREKPFGPSCGESTTTALDHVSLLVPRHFNHALSLFG